MNKIYIKHNPFTLKTDILVDGNVPKDDSDLYYLIYKEQRINKWIKYLPECLTSSFNQTEFDIVFNGIAEDCQCVKEYLENSQDIQLEHFVFEENNTIEKIKNELIALIYDLSISEIEELDKVYLSNIKENLVENFPSDLEMGINHLKTLICEMDSVMGLSVLESNYNYKKRNAILEQNELIREKNKLNEEFNMSKDELHDELSKNCFYDITAGSKKLIYEYCNDIKNKADSRFTKKFDYTRNLKELLEKASIKLDGMLKLQKQNGEKLIDNIRNGIAISIDQAKANFIIRLRKRNIDDADIDYIFELPELRLSIVTCADEIDVTDEEDKLYARLRGVLGSAAGSLIRKNFSEKEINGYLRDKIQATNQKNKEAMLLALEEQQNSLDARIADKLLEIVEKNHKNHEDSLRETQKLILEKGREISCYDANGEFIGSVKERLGKLLEF